MIDRSHDLPIVRQTAALGISRGCVYYLPRAIPASEALARYGTPEIFNTDQGGSLMAQ